MWLDLASLKNSLQDIYYFLDGESDVSGNPFEERLKSVLSSMLPEIENFLASSFAQLSGSINAAVQSGFGRIEDTLTNPSPSNSQAVQSYSSEIESRRDQIDSYASEVEVTMSPENSEVLESQIDSIGKGAGEVLESAFSGDTDSSIFGFFKLPWLDTDFKIFGIPVVEWLLLVVIVFSYFGVLLHG